MKRFIIMLILFLMCVTSVASAGHWEAFCIALEEKVEYDDNPEGFPQYGVTLDSGSSSICVGCFTDSEVDMREGTESGAVSVTTEYMVGQWWIEDFPFDPPTNVRVYFSVNTHHFDQAVGGIYTMNGWWSLAATMSTEVSVGLWSSSVEAEGEASFDSDDAYITRSATNLLWNPNSEHIIEISNWDSFYASHTGTAESYFSDTKDSNYGHFVYWIVSIDADSSSYVDQANSPGCHSSAGGNCYVSLDYFVLELD